MSCLTFKATNSCHTDQITAKSPQRIVKKKKKTFVVWLLPSKQQKSVLHACCSRDNGRASVASWHFVQLGSKKNQSVLLFVNLFINAELRNRPAPEGKAVSVFISCAEEEAAKEASRMWQTLATQTPREDKAPWILPRDYVRLQRSNSQMFKFKIWQDKQNHNRRMKTHLC